jgi:putative endonuclease
MPNPARRAAFARGLSAESRAAALLIVKGYRIAARRWKSPVGEIDIVARRRNLLIFVEVKARIGHDEAALAITPRQRRRIVSAAQAWLARHPADATCAIRFDAVLVAPWRLPRHMPAAFNSDD